VRVGEVPFAKRSVKELAAQGSYRTSYGRGLLGSLVGSGRDPPLTPDAFAGVMSTKNFTNGADSGTVIDLYRRTATDLLGSTRELRYKELKWSQADFERLGEALRYCGALETLEVWNMEGLSDKAAAAVVAGLASCASLQTLDLRSCSSLTALPDLSALTSLKTLDLGGCRSLTALPDLSALVSLQTLELRECDSLAALPDLSSLAGLKVKDLPRHLQAWEDGGRKSFALSIRFQPGTRVRIKGVQNAKFAYLIGRGGTVAHVDLATLKYIVTLDEAMDESGRRDVSVTEDKLEPEAAEGNDSVAA